MNKQRILIQNTGLGYDLLCDGVVFCSLSTLRLAMKPAHEIICDLGLSHEVVFIGHV